MALDFDLMKENTSPMEQQAADIDRTFPKQAQESWSNPTQLDDPASAGIGALDPTGSIRADVFAHVLGTVDLHTLRRHHLSLAMAVVELAADAASPFPWTHDDPTVALLRAAAKLSLTAPEATSSAAAFLVDQLAAPVPNVPEHTARCGTPSDLSVGL